MKRTWAHALVATWALTGCLPSSGGDGGVDGGDGGISDATTDAGRVDAAPDRGPAVDGAVVDGGSPDASADAALDARVAADGSVDGATLDAAVDAAADAAVDAAVDASCADQPEVCDGLDNDCDGRSDESAGCLAPGALDPAYGTAGQLLETLGQTAEIHDLKVDAQGRAWLAGAVREDAGGWNMLAARATAAGALDPAWSADGWASVDFSGAADRAFALDVDASGAAVLVGFRTDDTANPALTKLADGGDLDAAFGRVSPAGLASGTYRGVAFQGGGLVAVGETRPTGRISTELVTRHTALGALDGAPLVSLGHPTDVRVRASAIAPNGTVAFAGNLEAGADDDAFLSVAVPGQAAALHTVDVDIRATRDRFLGMVPTAGGYLLVGETAGDLLIAHLDATGNPVAGFGDNGRVVLGLDGNRDQAFDAVVQPDGNFLIAGSTEEGGISRFLVMRITAAGALDRTFGTNGRAVLDLGHPDQDAEARSIALDPTGDRILVAGSVGPYNARRVVVVRMGR